MKIKVIAIVLALVLGLIGLSGPVVMGSSDHESTHSLCPAGNVCQNFDGHISFFKSLFEGLPKFLPLLAFALILFVGAFFNFDFFRQRDFAYSRQRKSLLFESERELRRWLALHSSVD